MSDLARELAEAVTEAEDGCLRRQILRRQIASFLGRFQVNDLVCDKQNLKVVLLCESPHTEETKGRDIKDRYPLAGRSGKDVTNILRKYVLCKGQSAMPDEAVGELVKKKDPCFKWLGIMNASTLPLQATAYCQKQDFYGKSYAAKDVTVLLSILRSFETILGNPGASTRQDRQTKCVDNLMQKDLKSRLKKIPNKCELLFVFCGEVAQKRFKAAVGEGEYKKYKSVCVPHPSGDRWKGSDNKTAIEDMCEQIEHALKCEKDK